jgi:hypothetical protein
LAWTAIGHHRGKPKVQQAGRVARSIGVEMITLNVS